MPNKQREKLRRERAQVNKTRKIQITTGIGLIALVLIVVTLATKGRINEELIQGSIPTVGYKQYKSPPPMIIDVTKNYIATITMSKGGSFVIQLFPDKAPLTVNNFVFLAEEGFFNGVTFHRVLAGFMAQTGDPIGTGTGGPGYEFVNEDSDLVFDKPGIVAMANAGRDTNGSQFFITFGPAEHLNGGYTIFGQVIDGMDVVLGITLRDPNQFPDFPGDAIESILISEQY